MKKHNAYNMQLKIIVLKQLKIWESLQKKGGLCFITDYINRWDSLEWQYKEGHKWKASAKNIFKETWCQRCNTSGRKCVVPNQKIIPIQGHITSEQECIPI